MMWSSTEEERDFILKGKLRALQDKSVFLQEIEKAERRLICEEWIEKGGIFLILVAGAFATWKIDAGLIKSHAFAQHHIKALSVATICTLAAMTILLGIGFGITRCVERYSDRVMISRPGRRERLGEIKSCLKEANIGASAFCPIVMGQ